MTISATTILSSINFANPSARLTTMVAKMPRSILAEFNTHRDFSRNAASTRAIPTPKLIEQVMTDPFIPLVWGKNVPGMQHSGVHEDAALCEYTWLKARDAAVKSAESLLALGLHKQIAGRLLESWMWTIVCFSSTKFDNFLQLRDHSDAEPHMGVLAREIRIELEKPAMQVLKPGEWHTPFVDRTSIIHELLDPYLADGDTAGASVSDEEITQAVITKSTACCASTSYKTVEGFDMTLQRASAIYDKLVTSKPIHASPCEHVAMADKFNDQQYRNMEPKGWVHRSEHRNFVGFRQHRAMIGA